jgi:hypothetical protein
MNKHIGKIEYIVKSFTIILAALYPFFCLFYHGYLSSLSQYWNTDLQPLFIFSNIMTSYYLFTLKNWKLSGILLSLTTAFSIEYYPDIHNILAGIFFIATIWPLYKSNRFKYYTWIYLCSLPILAFSMFFAEIFAILTICTFHIHSLNKMYTLQKKRSN